MPEKRNTVELSVIVPFYNCQNYLRQCLDSILSQKDVLFELILVNDGSTDGSEQIAAQYAQNDERIILFNQPNKGIPFARNKGLELVQGKYFLFIDADDYIAPNSLRVLLKKATDNFVDILQLAIYRVFPNQQPQKWTLYPVTQSIPGQAYFSKMIKKHSMRIAPYCNMVRREFALSQPFRFDENLTRMQDFEYYTKLMIMAERVMNINYPYYFFRIDSQTDVKKDRHNIVNNFRLYHIINNNFEHFAQQQGLSNKIKQQLNWFICSHVSNYNSISLKQLPYDERIYWKKFIKTHIWDNGGWLRPYVYERYFRFIKL